MALNPTQPLASNPLSRTALSLSAALALGLAAVAPAQADTSFSKVVAFGDSLTDTGNLLQVTTILNAVAPALMPSPLPQPGDYYNGRFSNGRVAVEVLADGLLGTVGDGQSLSLENYAYGGAKTGSGGQLPNTGMLAQLDTFTKRLQPGAGADASALYFVWGGANDLRDIDSPAQVAPVITAALTNLSTVVTTLYGLGARNFLLPSLPDLGLTPEALSQGAAFSMGATGLSEYFNFELGRLYGGLELMLPGVNLITFDTMSAQRGLIASGTLDNVTDACFTGYVGLPGATCANASEYLYWDKVHPTTTTHEVLGMQMLAAVPEPSTVLSMGLGLLTLIGLSTRRRRGA